MLLRSTVCLAASTPVHATDLAAHRLARIEYARICDAYGRGFLHIPGSDACVRLGGLLIADWAVSNTPDRYSQSNAATLLSAYFTGGGFIPGVTAANFITGKSRDAVASQALARIEMDTRTQSPWGTVRTFLRVDSYFGSGATTNTGALPNALIGQPTNLGTTAARETAVLSKGFIQFAGITMGRTQSLFDFYADAVGYTNHVGSNQTVNAIAYTATFGGDLSASLSIEDGVSHRANAATCQSARSCMPKHTHGVANRPVGLAQDPALLANGQAFKSQNDLIRGRVRMNRTF